MACNPLIDDPFDFPRRAANRPGLPRIAYRIGRYADFVEAMTRRIDAAPALAAWTHRDPDDPGIALLQGAAILGDILTFYQEHYANEAYLRTAAWRESVAELVRLTGYRLAPGTGGRATLAFEVRRAAPVTIRAGFPVKVELADLPDPADFQTRAELLAWPHLSRFHVYRPRRYASTLPAGSTSFELAAVDGAADEASLAAFELKPGDRLLLLPPEPAWTASATAPVAGQAPQLVKVKKTTRLLGRVLVDIDAPLQQAWLQPVTACRVNRSFRHFGHNAPPVTVTATTGSGGTITGATQTDTGFARHVSASHDCTNTSAAFPLAPTLLPLDAEVRDLHPGMPVVVQTRVDAGGGTAVQLAVLRTIAALDVRTTGFGSLQGASTLLTLDRPLLTYANAAGPLSDVRDFSITEVTSPSLQLQPASAPDGGAFADGNGALAFHGTAREAQALAGRRLWLAGAAAGIELVCNNTPADFATPDPDAARMWPLAFDRPPLPFTRADFDETAPTVDVFGNLADATQGKAEREAVLGNGDNRQAWQTFALPKAPLTWFVSAGAFPPYVPELEVRVAGRAWTRVDAFYGHGAGDTVYVVREDAEGRAFVQFGDGTTGARLPSGLNNVVAVYRTGTGAHGPARPGSAPAAGERPPGFDKVALAGIVAGGAAPEDAARARVTAPGKVQSLGRLVSIRDYETETLAVPGVVAAGAAWDLHAGVPAVLLRVLLAAGREAEFGAVRAALAHAQRCRGPDRFALVVEHAFPRHAFVDVRYARDPARSRADVEAAMRAALGLAGVAADERDGVFGLYARRLGEPEYASRIEGRLQNVDGVLWCEVSALGLCAPGADQADAPLPAAPRPRAAVLPCGPGELLQLAAGHLTLMPTAEPSPGECA